MGDLDRVLQAEAPDTVSSFLQRMGRTGRRTGQTSNTTFFCETTEGVLQAMAVVELAKAGWVESITIDGRCWPVVVHQLLAMALAQDGVTAEEAWGHLSRMSDFSRIGRDEFDRLIAWMLTDGALVLASGRMVLGPKAEKRFGRRNFMDLFAVFHSAQSYTVQTSGGHPLGSLNQAFVDRLVDGVSCFLLGGRPWAVLHVQHDDRRIHVEPAPRGRQPTWGGFLPQFLSREVCQQVMRLLEGTDAPGYLDAEAAAVLAEQRDIMRDALAPERHGIEVGDKEIRWWTFAGGRINATLRHALGAVSTDWTIVPDNFVLRVHADGVTEHRFREALAKLRDRQIWEDEAFWKQVTAALPNYRLSKFQPLMPSWIEREMVARYLLDVDGARHWLSRQHSTLPS